MRCSPHMMLAIAVLAAPLLMGAYPEKSGDVVAAYSGTGTFLGPSSVKFDLGFESPTKTYWYFDGAFSYRHIFPQGTFSLGFNIGAVHSRFWEFNDSGGKGILDEATNKYVRCDYNINPEGCDSALATLTLLYFSPYLSYNPWPYFGFDIGALIRYTDQHNKDSNYSGKYYFDATWCILPSAAIRLGLLDKVYFEAYALRNNGPLFDSWFGLNMVFINEAPLTYFAIGVSALPQILAPQLSLKIAASDTIVIPVTGRMGFDGRWGASTGAEFSF